MLGKKIVVALVLYAIVIAYAMLTEETPVYSTRASNAGDMEATSGQSELDTAAQGSASPGYLSVTSNVTITGGDAASLTAVTVANPDNTVAWSSSDPNASFATTYTAPANISVSSSSSYSSSASTGSKSASCYSSSTSCYSNSVSNSDSGQNRSYTSDEARCAISTSNPPANSSPDAGWCSSNGSYSSPSSNQQSCSQNNCSCYQNSMSNVCSSPSNYSYSNSSSEVFVSAHSVAICGSSTIETSSTSSICSNGADTQSITTHSGHGFLLDLYDLLQSEKHK